jgi:hypothetical protein
MDNEFRPVWRLIEEEEGEGPVRVELHTNGSFQGLTPSEARAVARARAPARRQFEAARRRLQRAGASLNEGFRRSALVQPPADALPAGAPPAPLKVHFEADTLPRNAGAERGEADKYLPSMVCPITGEAFRDPVQAEDGHSYEREAIAHWLTHCKPTSPVTGATMGGRLVPNHSLRKAVDETTELLLQK